MRVADQFLGLIQSRWLIRWQYAISKYPNVLSGRSVDLINSSILITLSFWVYTQRESQSRNALSCCKVHLTMGCGHTGPYGRVLLPNGFLFILLSICASAQRFLLYILLNCGLPIVVQPIPTSSNAQRKYIQPHIELIQSYSFSTSTFSQRILSLDMLSRSLKCREETRTFASWMKRTMRDSSISMGC